MRHYTTEKLEDGILSFDCKYCGHSFLERRGAWLHWRDAHAPAFKAMRRYFRKLTGLEFSQLWVTFCMRRIPKREKPEAYFARIIQRDLFAAEVKRRKM